MNNVFQISYILETANPTFVIAVCVVENIPPQPLIIIINRQLNSQQYYQPARSQHPANDARVTQV